MLFPTYIDKGTARIKVEDISSTFDLNWLAEAIIYKEEYIQILLMSMEKKVLDWSVPGANRVGGTGIA